MSRYLIFVQRLILPTLTLLLAACGAGQPPSLVPAGAQPVARATVQEWVAPMLPAGRQIVRFRWLYKNEQSSAGGRGSARIASPDSLRLDGAGPLGAGKFAGVVVDDSALWARPEEDFRKLVPDYTLMWAMLGIARPPKAGAVLRGQRLERATVWQYADGADSIEYSRTATTLSARVKKGASVTGWSETTFGPDGLPAKARLIVPSGPARVDITFTKRSTVKSFEADVWAPAEPDTAEAQ